MKATGIFAALVVSTVSLLGQGFVNLGFERPPFPQPPAPTGVPQFLDWGTWAPGWSHSSGSDTGVLYYGLPHVGISQWYLLVRNPGSTELGQPLVGSYSLAMHSGYFNAHDGSSPWTEAFISQTALVPSGTMSLRFQATRPVAVFANGAPVPLVSLGGNVLGGDFAAYDGQPTELKIMNVTTPGDLAAPPTLLDDITFSSAPIPEPGTMALLALGATVALALRRRKSHAD